MEERELSDTDGHPGRTTDHSQVSLAHMGKARLNFIFVKRPRIHVGKFERKYSYRNENIVLRHMQIFRDFFYGTTHK